MNPSFRRRSLAVVLFVAGFLPAWSAPEYPGKGPDIYDVHADGSAQVASAVTAAAGSNKRVIVVFGANWCIWCRRLHGELTKNPAVTKALSDFVVVEVDVNTRNGVNRNAGVVATYGVPISKGIPAMAVLDSNGRLLTRKDTDELEEGDGYSTDKIVAFLGSWTSAAH